VQKLSGDATVASLRQTALFPSAEIPKSLQRKRSRSHINFAKQGNQGRAQRQSRRSLHAGKVPNGVRWKNLLRHYKPSPPPDGEFVPSFILWSWRRDSNPRPSDYKSDALPTELRQQFRGSFAPSRKPIPLIPFRMSGTIVKVTTRGTARASNGRAKRLSLRAVHVGGRTPWVPVSGRRQTLEQHRPHRDSSNRGRIGPRRGSRNKRAVPWPEGAASPGSCSAIVLCLSSSTAAPVGLAQARIALGTSQLIRADLGKLPDQKNSCSHRRSSGVHSLT
jgi:hypothetical protein